MSKKVKATVIKNGKSIEVYRRESDSMHVDFSDCKTLYEKEELNIPKNQE